MEKTLNIEMKNCYGIPQLKHKFNFDKGKCNIIYASNGVMKTSFLKSIKDYKNNIIPKELIQNIDGILNIDSNFIDNLKNDIISVDSFLDEDTAIHGKNLVSSARLVEKYNAVTEPLNKLKDNILKKLSSSSGLKEKNFLEQFCKDIGVFNNDIFQALTQYKNTLKEFIDMQEDEFNFKYTDIFNSNTEKLLQEKDFLEHITDYINAYKHILSKSQFFGYGKGNFNHKNAEKIAQELIKRGYFKAGHFITVQTDKTTENQFKDSNMDSLTELIKKEMEEIENNAQLKKKFTIIEKHVGDLVGKNNFIELLRQNTNILLEISNPSLLRQKLWKSYLKQISTEYFELITNYENAYPSILEIKKEIKKERSKWDSIVAQFKNSFIVPFEISIKNKEDALLGIDTPIFEFTIDGIVLEEEKIRKEILSQGERRALYFLRILFDMEQISEDQKNKIFIFDDIADSFDYKNKHAIIEWLYNMNSKDNIYTIILTHNYDFFRSVIKRLEIPREYQFIAHKKPNKIEVQIANYRNNHPFIDWRKNIHKEKNFICCIPLIRNLIEYTNLNYKDTEEYNILSKLLHYNNKIGITLSNIENIFKSYCNVDQLNKLPIDKNKSIHELILETATQLTFENTDLQDKIILSMAIRIKAEEYLFSILTKQSPNKIEEYEADIKLSRLISYYKDEFNLDIPTEIYKAHICSPDNIHLNSFMYEPLVDVSIDELLKIYDNILALNKK